MASPFIQAFNTGHTAFRKSKGEEFTVVGGQTVNAIEIAELTAQELARAGGKYADNTVTLHVFKSDLGTIADGVKIIVRGKRLRVDQILDSGDNSVMIMAGPAGANLR
jgi:hypothetical protein